MNPHSFDPASKAKSKKGCLFGCLGAAIGVPVLLVIIGYLLLMHTSLPLKFMAKAINEDPNITIEGIGGSISKGITIDSLRASDGSGNESVFEGLTLQWGDINRMRTKREVVIEEIGLKRAHIFIDLSDTDTDTDTDTETPDQKTADTDSSSKPLNLFEIKKIDIREVVIEAKTGDFKLELDEFLMKGFRIKGDDFELASLSLVSSMIDLSLEDADTVILDGKVIPFKRRIIGTAKSEMYEELLRDIGFTIELGAMNGEMVTRFQAFDGAVEIISFGENGKDSATFKNLTPADYLGAEHGGPVKELSMNILSGEIDPETGIESEQLENGSLTLGTAKFTMEQQQISEYGKGVSTVHNPILATTQRGGLTITAALTKDESPPFFKLDLSSEPVRDQNEIISQLWFEKPYADLPAEQVAEVKNIAEKHFSNPD